MFLNNPALQPMPAALEWRHETNVNGERFVWMLLHNPGGTLSAGFDASGLKSLIEDATRQLKWVETGVEVQKAQLVVPAPGVQPNGKKR